MEMSSENILGVRVDRVSKKKALARVSDFLSDERHHKVFTPNPEMILEARRDKSGGFGDVLNSGDLNICDGRGIQLVAGEGIERIPGTDFMLDICGLAEKEGKSVYLLGSGDDEVVKRASDNLKKQFPKLRIVGQHKGPEIASKQVSSGDNEQVLLGIREAGPDILFVAFGHKKQEMWIHENLSKMSSVKVAMGVGGAFDFIAGKISRAPKWMQKIGLEWVYRLVREPWRIKRIWNATAVFLYYVYVKRR